MPPRGVFWVMLNQSWFKGSCRIRLTRVFPLNKLKDAGVLALIWEVAYRGDICRQGANVRIWPSSN